MDFLHTIYLLEGRGGYDKILRGELARWLIRGVRDEMDKGAMKAASALRRGRRMSTIIPRLKTMDNV